MSLLRTRHKNTYYFAAFFVDFKEKKSETRGGNGSHGLLLSLIFEHWQFFGSAAGSIWIAGGEGGAWIDELISPSFLQVVLGRVVPVSALLGRSLLLGSIKSCWCFVVVGPFF